MIVFNILFVKQSKIKRINIYFKKYNFLTTKNKLLNRFSKYN